MAYIHIEMKEPSLLWEEGSGESNLGQEGERDKGDNTGSKRGNVDAQPVIKGRGGG